MYSSTDPALLEKTSRGAPAGERETRGGSAMAMDSWTRYALLAVAVMLLKDKEDIGSVLATDYTQLLMWLALIIGTRFALPTVMKKLDEVGVITIPAAAAEKKAAVKKSD
jgi:hypothetical protein